MKGQWEERFERRYGFWRGFVNEQVLRLYFLHHRELLGGLARAAWETVLELMCTAVDDVTFRPGMIAFVQTSGDLGNWQPHTHAMVLRGGWTADGEWAPVPFMDEHSAELLLRHKVMRLLQDEGLLSEERTELQLSWHHTGFSVNNRVYVEPEDQTAVERLARHIMRPPISLDRMSWDGEGEVRYRRKGGHEDPALHLDPVETFDPSEFLARVIMHIPEPRRHLVRYYGWYSNVSRGRRRLREEAAESACSPGEGHSPSTRAKKDQGPAARALRRSWAKLIKRIYEVDPLVCPSCGAEMKVIAFINEHKVADKILRHLKPTEGMKGRGPPRHAGLGAAS